LLQVEQILKEVDNAQQHIHILRRALEEQDVEKAEFISSQKVSNFLMISMLIIIQTGDKIFLIISITKFLILLVLVMPICHVIGA